MDTTDPVEPQRALSRGGEKPPPGALLQAIAIIANSSPLCMLSVKWTRQLNSHLADAVRTVFIENSWCFALMGRTSDVQVCAEAGRFDCP